MGKAKTIRELANMLAIALRHRIGSIVNENEIYAQKYAKDADVLLKEAQKIALKENWSQKGKERIKEELKKKLKAELEKKEFLNARKFAVMEEETEKALELLGLK